MKIPAIHRKMLRDLRGMWGQAVAIGLVTAAGVVTYVTMTSVSDTLEGTLAGYYTEQRFADGFAQVRRAPASVAGQLRDIPGVGRVDTRVTARVNLEVPDFTDPVDGLLVSVPEGGQPDLNQLVLRQGRWVEAGREEEVILNEIFAEAHGLGPGDRLGAILNGRRRTLEVVGIALSPDFLMQLQPGSLFPDPERYGVLWMGREGLEAAADMVGAFNDVSFSVAPGVPVDDVLAAVDRTLEPWGGPGAQARSDQASHALVTEEFRQLRGMAALLPVIFLGVAAFLLNIVVTRLIHLQRPQIAVLKAFGYRNAEIGWHYMQLVLLVAVGGALVGTGIGSWLGRLMADLYLEFYRFPFLDYTLRWQVAATAILLTVGAASLGVLRSVRVAAALPPAEAMRPPPPALYRPTLPERLGLQRLFDQPTRMILRNVERQAMKSFLTVLGVASSCALLIMGLFFGDALDHMVRVQFSVAQQEDLTASFVEPTSFAAIHELRSLPGVQMVEPFRSVPVRLRYRHRTYATAIQGIPPGAYLRRTLGPDLEPIPIPPQGIVLTDRLAVQLGVEAGDWITVEVREGPRRIREVQVAALAEQFLGLGAYMDLEAANRLAGGGDAVSGALLMVDSDAEAAITAALRDRPRVAAVVYKDRAVRSFMDSSAGSLLVFTFILSLFAGVIAFGVVYNSMRIALSERDRELASLRVLGFTRGEIAYILLGEMAVLVLLAIPLGLVLGVAGAHAAADALASDLLRIPVVLSRSTFTLAASVVLGASVVSALMVRRRLNRLDLIGVLKTRE